MVDRWWAAWRGLSVFLEGDKQVKRGLWDVATGEGGLRRRVRVRGMRCFVDV